jgi:hypothetical protein
MASKKQYTVPLRIPEDLLRKLMLLCDKEGRTLNNELIMLARNAVAYHERAKGGLDAKAAAALDLSPYEDAQQAE